MKPRLRNNIGQFQKYATVRITKKLGAVAEETERDVTKIVKEKLLETYKTNVLLSYGPRSQAGREVKEYNEDPYRAHRKKLTYRHTHTFEDSINVVVDDKTVKIVIEDAMYPDGASTEEVYKWLTEGTVGGGTYKFYTKKGAKWAYNYPTPAHLFEEFTKIQMKGFLDSLENDIRKGNYSRKKYTKKKKG